MTILSLLKPCEKGPEEPPHLFTRSVVLFLYRYGKTTPTPETPRSGGLRIETLTHLRCVRSCPHYPLRPPFVVPRKGFFGTGLLTPCVPRNSSS